MYGRRGKNQATSAGNYTGAQTGAQIGTAAFLASDESDYMTGQLLMIDGGMVMQ